MMDAREVLDLLPKPVAVVDAALRVHHANRAFATRFGTARPAAATGGRQAFWDGLARTVDRMQPAARQGTFRWVAREPGEQPFDVHVTRTPDDGFLVVADDVSAYVQLERIQGGVRRYVERVLNHLDQAITVVDPELRVTFFNPAQERLWRRCGLDPSLDLIGEPVARACPLLTAAEWEDVREPLTRGETVRRTGLCLVTEGGELRFDLAVLPLAAPGEASLGAICVTTASQPPAPTW